MKLPEAVFGLKWNADLVHQVVTSMMTDARTPVAHTKTRGEVSGGGKKPWQQKGTGRARHGSIRSPIWVGGGIAHGPRNEKNFDRKVSKKMKIKALFTILSKKAADGQVMFLDEVKLPAPKTKEAKKIVTAIAGIKGFEKLAYKKKNAALVAVPEYSADVERAFRNFPNIEVVEARNLNPLSLLNYTFAVFADPKKTISHFESKLGQSHEGREKGAQAEIKNKNS